MSLRELLMVLGIVVSVAALYMMVTDDPSDRRVAPTRETLGTLVTPQTSGEPVKVSVP